MEKQIQAQVLAIRRSVKNGSQHFAIRSAEGWKGPDRLTIGGIEHLVSTCVSDLQLREALLTAERESMPSVLLCSMPSDALGDDVIDRLAKRRVFAPKLGEIVAELFSVTSSKVDPRILGSKPLMNALLDRVPHDGYAPVASGMLDLQTAWLALLSGMLGKPVESPSLAHFLEWSRSPDQVSRLGDMEPELKAAFIEWFARSRGESVRFMMAAIGSGFGNDLIPLGAVLGLVFDPEHDRDSEHQKARGRLERYLQHQEIDTESARAWARTADGVLKQMSDSEDKRKARRLHLNRVDELVTELGLEDQAWISRCSPAGLEQRYGQVGQTLKKALTSKTSAGLDKVRNGILQIRKHLLGEDDLERLERVEMACRLIQWLQTTDTNSSASLDVMVNAYHESGGFVDWARNRLKETDESPDVQKAYDAILQRANERASAFEKGFGLQLQDWTASDRQSERFMPIEAVLKKVVTPVAKQQPVLMLVLDGMSVAVFRLLLQDILRHEWTEITHDGHALPRPVLATLPSVTNVSRRALFYGELSHGTSVNEESAFKNNDFLYQETGSQKRPQLFKMGDLSEESQSGIASKVRTAIADKKCHAVSVVLNAIDDHLDSGKQVDFTWTRNSIRGLRDLFRYAAEAKRLVILTSDHGHVLDFGAEPRPSIKGERGDRFRLDDAAPGEGELEFTGSRVSQAMGRERITLPWSDAIRYSTSKRGYHGGANPQEMVVPMAILADIRSEMPEGWQAIPSYQPNWWQIDGSKAAPLPVTKPKTEKAVEGLELFELAPVKTATAGPGWIGALLASPIYEEQSKLAVRGAPAEDVITTLLGGLDARGGTAIKPALAQELGLPPFRLDGLIQNVSRMLNVDGYEVLTHDRNSDTVSLNVALLKTQFDLTAL